MNQSLAELVSAVKELLALADSGMYLDLAATDGCEISRRLRKILREIGPTV